MRTFQDNQGQKWNLSISLADLRKHRNTLGLDLFSHKHHTQVMESLLDQLSFCFLLCEEQAKKLDVSIEEFEERLQGDGIATEAGVQFLEALADFYLSYGKKALAMLTQVAIRAIRAGEARMADLEETGQIDSLIAQADKEVEKALHANDGRGLQN